jgi:phytoene dehydrogenase-like protein
LGIEQPIPWKAAECARAGTVHLGGTLAEIIASENAPAMGYHPEKPFVLVTQPSLFDSSRAPAGKHTAWAYCHVPNGSTFDMTRRIENQIERFAPGFRDCIIAKKASPPAELERHNANLVGGNISGGAQDIRQLFLRPTRSFIRPRQKIFTFARPRLRPAAAFTECADITRRRRL